MFGRGGFLFYFITVSLSEGSHLSAFVSGCSVRASILALNAVASIFWRLAEIGELMLLFGVSFFNEIFDFVLL